MFLQYDSSVLSGCKGIPCLLQAEIRGSLLGFEEWKGQDACQFVLSSELIC